MSNDGLPQSTLSYRSISAVLTAFSLCVICVGLYFSFGSILPLLLVRFETPEFAGAAVGSLGEGAFNITCLLGGGFSERYGICFSFFVGAMLFCGGLLGDAFATSIAMFCISHSIVGVGMGLICICYMGVLHRHTPTKSRGLCVGFACFGAGVGMVVISSFMSIGQEQIGTQLVFVYGALGSAIVFALCFLIMCSLERTYSYVKRKDDGEPAPTQKESVCSGVAWIMDGRYSLFFVGLMLYAVGLTVPYAFNKEVAFDNGISEKDARLLPICTGIGESLGLLFFGALGDWLGDFSGVFTVMVFVSACIQAILPRCSDLAVLTLVNFMYGSVSGGRAGLMSLVSLEIVGQDRVMSFYGACCCMFICSSIGSPVVGAIRDATGSFRVGFSLVSFLGACGGLCLLCHKRHAVPGIDEERRYFMLQTDL